MGKAANRKRDSQAAQPGDVHERIQTEAKRNREASGFKFADSDPSSALGGLLEAARKAVGNATPVKIIYEGAPYWLRVSTGVAFLEVYDSPAAAKPMAASLVGSTDRFGHMPGH